MGDSGEARPAVLHVCTSRSLSAGGVPAPDIRCAICDAKGGLILGWIGAYCERCGRSYGYLSEIVAGRRRHAGISRKEAAAAYGVKTSTIRRYEHSRPPKKYELFTERWISQGQKESQRPK